METRNEQIKIFDILLNRQIVFVVGVNVSYCYLSGLNFFDISCSISLYENSM